MRRSNIFKEYGTDSQLGLMASIMMSSTETVLYCMSLYFGSVKITKTRFTLPGALLATAAGVAASAVLAGAMAEENPIAKKPILYYNCVG